MIMLAYFTKLSISMFQNAKNSCKCLFVNVCTLDQVHGDYRRNKINVVFRLPDIGNANVALI